VHLSISWRTGSKIRWYQFDYFSFFVCFSFSFNIFFCFWCARLSWSHVSFSVHIELFYHIVFISQYKATGDCRLWVHRRMAQCQFGQSTPGRDWDSGVELMVLLNWLLSARIIARQTYWLELLTELLRFRLRYVTLCSYVFLWLLVNCDGTIARCLQVPVLNLFRRFRVLVWQWFTVIESLNESCFLGWWRIAESSQSFFLTSRQLRQGRLFNWSIFCRWHVLSEDPQGLLRIKPLSIIGVWFLYVLQMLL